ncbi:MAG: hypothetical protein KDD82_31520 [Planctomycetes bacterium]|nr:hypothetical protein [Planctomycetota bacterium]
MKVLVGLVLVGCGLGIVGIQTFGNPAEWATTVPGDLGRFGLAVIATLALVVGGMVMTPSASAAPNLPPPVEAVPAPKKAKRAEPAEVLSLDDDEEAARRRARRAARRKKALAAERAAAAAAETGEAAPTQRKRTRSSKDGARKTKTSRSKSDSGVAERPRKRKRTREHAISGRS